MPSLLASRRRDASFRLVKVPVAVNGRCRPRIAIPRDEQGPNKTKTGLRAVGWVEQSPLDKG